VSTPTHHAAAVCSLVLLVVASDRVSQTAITCAAGLAAGGPVTVIGVGRTEDVRRAVALAMSVLENGGVQAHGHVAVSGPPARAVARMARARGVRAIVLDQADGLTTDLRRRVHGSGIVVVLVTERGGRLAAHRDRLAR
jgi:hypothetical protein